jgi:D-amino peptidase
LERIAKRALEAFLSLTRGNSDSELVLRALVLHMLEGYRPQVFNKWNLVPLLQEAIHRLIEVSCLFPPVLTPDDGLARVDAIYVLHERNLPYELPQHFQFLNYLMHLDQNGFGLYSWVMSELMKDCGLDLPLIFDERPFKSSSRLLDTYWVTHLYLLDTRYLQIALRNSKAQEWTKDLVSASNWVLGERRFDLAAEIGICLQLAGETATKEYQMIVNTLVRHQRSDGSLQDLTLDITSVAHTTAACLLLFTGAQEAYPV